MAKEITFQIDENLTPFAGIALIDCLDSNGASSSHLVPYGHTSIDRSHATGLLVLGLSHVQDKSVVELMQAQVNAQHQAPGGPQNSWQNQLVLFALMSSIGLFLLAITFFYMSICS